jgi:starch synthase
MRIVLASSEAVPFSKTGGLADVASALAKGLSAAGHQVWLVVPYYSQVHSRQGAKCPTVRVTGQSFRVGVGSKQVAGSLLWSELPGSDVSVLLVDQP